MDWTNETVIEFVQLLQTEPSIWNHRAKSSRNRIVIHEAWNRIKNSFSLSCTLEDLKRKRNSLLTQYRDNLRKIKESQQNCPEGEEMYKPSWFAFDVMNSYLNRLYEGSPANPVSIKSEDVVVSYGDDELSNDSDNYEVPPSRDLDSGLNPNKRIAWESNTRILHARSLSHDSTPSEHDYHIPKKQRMQELRLPPQEKDERYQEEDRVKECELYGQLLAEKLKPLEQDERLQLMNEIDNLVFNHLMKIRKQKANRNNCSVGQLPGPSKKLK